MSPSAKRRPGPYWRLYDTDLDYGRVESVLSPESALLEEAYREVSGYKTQKGLIQLYLRKVKDVMVQISPGGKVTVYYSRPQQIEQLENRVRDLIQRLCGRRIIFSWVKSDPIQEQYYYDAILGPTVIRRSLAESRSVFRLTFSCTGASIPLSRRYASLQLG